MASIAHPDIARTAERQHGLITLDQLLDAGAAQRSVQRWIHEGRLVAEATGVFRLAGCPPSFPGRVLAAVLEWDEGTWASHRTAAALWGLEGFPSGGRIELTRRTGTSGQRAGASVHRSTRLPNHHVTTVAQIPATTLSRTLFDLARSTGARRLDRAVEAALRTDRCSIASLYRVLGDLGGRGRPGTTRMREVLAWRGRDYVPTESELDVVGRAAVSSVPGIEWQVPISDERGYIRRVDGLLRSAGVVIEWDGAAYHDGPWRRSDDAAGDARLEALGLRVRRYRWHDVTLGADAVRRELLDLAGRSAARSAPASPTLNAMPPHVA